MTPESVQQKIGQLANRINKRNSFLIKQESDQSLTAKYVSYGDIQIDENTTIPCDTAIDTFQLSANSSHVSFTTLLTDGVSGNDEDVFNKVTDVLNAILPGKVLHDYNDGSRDVLYSTNERAANLTQKVLEEQLNLLVTS